MIEKDKIPVGFRPTFTETYEVFGRTIVVQLEYLGPVPGFELDSTTEPEVYLFAIYHNHELFDCGRIKWNPNNGPLTFSEAAKALVLQIGSLKK